MIERDVVEEVLRDHENFWSVRSMNHLEELQDAAKRGDDSEDLNDLIRVDEFTSEIEAFDKANKLLHEGSGISDGAIAAFDEGFRRLGFIEINQAGLTGFILGVQAQRLSEERARG